MAYGAKRFKPIVCNYGAKCGSVGIEDSIIVGIVELHFICTFNQRVSGDVGKAIEFGGAIEADAGPHQVTDVRGHNINNML